MAGAPPYQYNQTPTAPPPLSTTPTPAATPAAPQTDPALMSQEERDAMIKAQMYGRPDAGVNYLEKWGQTMPTGYQLGGDPNQANAYAAQAQQTGQEAQDSLNSFAQQSVGAGYEFGQQIAGAGQRAETAGQQLGTDALSQGQQLGGQAQNMGERLGGDVMGFGAQQAGTLGGMSQQFLGEGAGAGGRQAANLNFGAMQQNLSDAGPNFAGADRSLGQASQYGSQLAGVEAQEGPSAAQAQLRAGLNQAQAGNIAMARSGRGWGGSAGAQQAAMTQNAAAGQSAVNASATLRAQEDAARRQRMAQNLAGAAGISQGVGQQQIAQQGLASNVDLARAGLNLNQEQLSAQTALQQQQQNDAFQQGMYGLGLGAQQAGGQLGLQGLTAGAGIAQQGMGQNIGAQQSGMGMNIGAQQQGIGQNIGAQQAAGSMQLGALGQAGGLVNTGAMTGLTAQQQALAAQQQQVANNLAYGNQMINIRGQDMGAHQAHAAVDAGADAASNARIDSYVAAAADFGGSMIGSDRNIKKDIKPTNGELAVPDIDQLAAEDELLNRGNPYSAQVAALPAEPQFNPFSQGVGISGPGQLPGASASMGAASAASGAAQGQKAAAERDAMFSKFGKAAQGFGKAIGGGGPQQFSAPPAYQPIDVGVPQAAFPTLSDKNEKSGYSMSDEDAKEAIDKTPGYSFRYKDPDAMGADEGLQFGIMAQDLEKTPAGRSVVKKQPDGTRMVDTSRLALMEAGAMNAFSQKQNALVEEVARLKAMVGKKGKRAA